MKCAHCKRKIDGSYITLIVDAEELHFCHEEHVSKFFKERDRVVLEEYARSQQEAQEKK